MIERADKLNNQAIILANEGDYIEAIACFKRALIIQRDNYLLWYNLGITYRDSGDIYSAINSLEKAHQIAPERTDVIETLATLFFQNGEFEAALECIAEGLELAPQKSSLWNLRGVVAFNMENYAFAGENFEKALCLNPYYEDALYNLRDTYEQLNNSAGMQECAKRINELK